MSSVSSFVQKFGPVSGPGSTRRVLIVGGFVIGGAIAAVAATAVYRVKSTPTIAVPKVPHSQNGVGMSGSNEVRRTDVATDDTQAAEMAHRHGQTALISPEDSIQQTDDVRKTASAARMRETIQKRVEQPPDGDMTRGYLRAFNLAMAAAGPNFDDGSTTEFEEDKIRKQRADIQKASLTTGGKSASAKPSGHLIDLAGQRVMAVTVLAATMDPDSGKTPALVQMTSGPLAGYRLQGTIEKHDSGLTIPLDTLFYKNGQTVPVKAILVSPETQEVSVSCGVDHHYLLRIGLPALAGAAQGLGQAAQESGSSFASGPLGSAASYSSFSPWQIAGTMAGGAANGVQRILQDALPKGSTVTLCADVSVEVYFQDKVLLPEDN